MLSEQEQIRRNSLAELYKLGINPYPQAAFPVNVFTTDILNQFDDNNPDQFQEVTLAGRIMSRRIIRPHPTVYQARRDLPRRGQDDV